nr:MAG TPA: hypothetical protein [Caudoviricetes sp.]DAY74538.1 MAG TPA: hypothetical protein [Caudoviricetes sp.]
MTIDSFFRFCLWSFSCLEINDVLQFSEDNGLLAN